MAQTFYYNGDTYMYRVSEAGLKRYIKETGNSILQELSKRPENIVRILYYTVCWERYPFRWINSSPTTVGVGCGSVPDWASTPFSASDASSEMPSVPTNWSSGKQIGLNLKVQPLLLHYFFVDILSDEEEVAICTVSII